MLGGMGKLGKLLGIDRLDRMMFEKITKYLQYSCMSIIDDIMVLMLHSVIYC